MAEINLTQRIHKLSTKLANLIAAGEVVERPSSVVKELLDNSLDAGATEIKIHIKKGGISLIRIQDNGCGIHSDDLLLALTQHATSKLKETAELSRINTLGFRGEALSSIASVSKLKLSSRIPNEEHGWAIDVGLGDPDLVKFPISMAVGTSVEVRDLFFNTPARRKFLRTDNTEFFHICEIVKRVALSRYTISFHLKHNNKTILQCSGKQNSFAERVQAIFGKSFLANSFQLDYERNDLRIWGQLGHPEIARNQIDQQYFYLNGRVIRDKQVNHAIRMATQDYLYIGKHAVYVLFLEMNVSHVDVNVHPAKHEVRFRQARDTHDFIFSALKQVCAEENIPQQDPHQYNIQGQTAQGQTTQAQEASYTFPQNNDQNPAIQSALKSKPSTKNSNTYWNQPTSTSNDYLLIEERYLLIQEEEEILLIDIPLFQETVTLSKLRNDMATADIRRRPLLVPLTIMVSDKDADFIETKAVYFENFGLKIKRVAPDSLLICEIPLLLEYADITSLTNDMMSLLKSGKSNDEIIIMMSQHVNDAGLMKIDNQIVAQFLAKIRSPNIGSSAVKNMAWRSFDGKTLSNLLKRKF